MSTNWQYASLDMSSHGHHLHFTHNQGDNFVREAKAYFDRALKEGNSKGWYLDLNFSHIGPMDVLRFLGERGWELCAARAYVEAGGEYLLKHPIE